MRLWLALLLASAVSGATWDGCRELRHHGKLAEAKACFSKLLSERDALTRAEALWGLGRHTDANLEFRAAEKSQANPAVVKTEWGNLFLERYQPGDAAKLYEEAIEADSKYAPAYLGLARVAALGFDKKAIEFARQGLERDPKLYEAHELLAYLALEDNDPRAASEEAHKALDISSNAWQATAVLASIDWLNGKTDTQWQVYGEGYATGAHFFEINRRYEEAIAYYRKAIALDGELWAARSQLGVNLMRLGRADEAKQQLEGCYNAGFRDAETVNSLRLLDTLGNFQTEKTATTEVVLNKKEAALLRPYVQTILERAMATYERKYQMKLPGAARVEVFPNHEDFAVRTVGLPGVGGLLGVTFGMAVAMDSPSARPPGEFNWASTLWHEMSHVYVLTATHHLVPRWFTEGLAVHEEGAAAPDWGDRMTPEIIAALGKKQLLPVLQLDRGFVRPEYPTQVLVSYYQAGQICDFIAGKWGDAALVGMIHSYAARKTTAEAIQDNLHDNADVFDKEFNAWLDAKTGNTVKHFDEWKRGMKAAYQDFASGKKEEAGKQALAVHKFYPDYVGQNSGYELTADLYLSRGDKRAAVRELEAYRNAGGKNPETLRKLAGLERETANAKQAQRTLEALNDVYPEDAELHRQLGALLLAAGDAEGAVREGKAEVALNGDAVESHYELAKALHAAHRVKEAKDEVVLALEAAPDYKPAQQLLLQLSQ
jgi:tetratricopeptide (TPR) repeat protein